MSDYVHLLHGEPVAAHQRKKTKSIKTDKRYTPPSPEQNHNANCAALNPAMRRQSDAT
jgi:hypothetical protein